MVRLSKTITFRNLSATRYKYWHIGIEIEVDESKLEKRKYNCGHRVEVVWAIAGIE